MNKELITVLGIDFVNVRFHEMVSLIKRKIEKEFKTFIVTGNPEIVMFSVRHHPFKKIIKSAHYVVADGIGIVLAAKILKGLKVDRITGYDLTIQLLELANDHQWKVYVLGGKEEVNHKAVKHIKRKYPSINMVGYHQGYIEIEDEAVASEIKEKKPDIVLVAMGSPKQEKWIAHHFASFSKGIFIGVGGSIDVLAGEKKRAPSCWQNMKLEWLYRLIQQPSRWKRMLVIPQFLYEVVKYRWKIRS